MRNRGAGDRTKTIMKAGGNRSAGFTIVETMIVLVVSAALLATGMYFISGRQNKTQFMVAINDEKQFLEETINETANGYYPYTQAFTCTGKTDNSAALVVPASGPGQGRNNGCVFLGKAVAIGVGNTLTSMVIPVIGNQKSTTQDVTTFAQAHPVALGGGLNPSDTTQTLPDLSISSQQENGLVFQKANYTYVNQTVNPPTYTTYGGAGLAVFALVSDLSQYQQSNGNLVSASQRLDLLPFGGAESWARPASAAALTNLINGVTPPSTVGAFTLKDRPATSRLSRIDVCFTSGSTIQSGLITISGLGRLSVSLAIYNNKTCT